ncbi:MAG: hypothetical protein HQL98_15630 [Magnetococcales bacterium]|nr:hypothetical protein [Magnetococcales bacterium]
MEIKAGAVLMFAPTTGGGGGGRDPFGLQDPERFPHVAVDHGAIGFTRFGEPDALAHAAIRAGIAEALFDDGGQFDPQPFSIREFGLSAPELEAITHSRAGLTESDLSNLSTRSTLTREELQSLATDFGLTASGIETLLDTLPDAPFAQVVALVRENQGRAIESVIQDGRNLSAEQYDRLMARNATKTKTTRKETPEEQRKRAESAEKIELSIGSHTPCRVEYLLIPPLMISDADHLSVPSWGLGEVEIRMEIISSVVCKVSGTGSYVSLTPSGQRYGPSAQVYDVWTLRYWNGGVTIESDGGQGLRIAGKIQPFEVTVEGAFKTASIQIEPEYTFHKIVRPCELAREKEIHRKGITVDLYPPDDPEKTGDTFTPVELPSVITTEREYHYVDPKTGRSGGHAYTSYKTTGYLVTEQGPHHKKTGDFERGKDLSDNGRIFYAL